MSSAWSTSGYRVSAPKGRYPDDASRQSGRNLGKTLTEKPSERALPLGDVRDKILNAVEVAIELKNGVLLFSSSYPCCYPQRRWRVSSLSVRLGNRAIQDSEDGFNHGFFYSFWADAPGLANYTNGDGGSYTLDWDGYHNNGVSGWITAGKGWNPGGERVIKYNGTYNPIGNTFLSVYGWGFKPLIQYNIVDSYTDVDPSDVVTRMGTTTCNGASYTIALVRYYDYPTVNGSQVLNKYWSVRQPPKRPGGMISGEIDVACHFNAWRGYGMNVNLAELDLQILAVDSFRSMGSAAITVS